MPKELTKAEELILLTILRLGDAAYGVSIKRAIAEKTGKAIPYGTLYFLLDQLTAKEYVFRIKGEPTNERGGRRKTFFRLSDDGLAALRESLEQHKKAWDGLENLIRENG